MDKLNIFVKYDTKNRGGGMITSEQFTKLETLFDYYNKELFNGKLNDCLINMSRKKGANGFFAAERWWKENGNRH